eukprot:gene82-55_t
MENRERGPNTHGRRFKSVDSPKPPHAAAKELSKTNKVDPAANPCGPPLPNQQNARPALFGWGTGGSDKVACLGKCEFPLSPPTMATFASHNFGPDISINQFFRRISNGRKPNTYEALGIRSPRALGNAKGPRRGRIIWGRENE